VGKSRNSTAAEKPGQPRGAQERPRALNVLNRLIEEFPRPKTALGHENPFQLLIATILSAQCTDERVNMVTPGLFKRYPTAKHLAQANPAELEQEIRSTGFYRMKAKSMIACSKALVERHGGSVPSHMDALVGLPGVGRKTANVVLGQAFGIASGVVVDTHVHRLSQRLGFTKADDPIKIEQDLMALFPQQDWIDVGSVLILHGRRTCNARNPKCSVCRVAALCPSAEAFLEKLKR
jgi:endonuclease-3